MLTRMTDLITYKIDHGVVTIVMDDGKVNALSPAMLAELGGALDRAEAEDALVVLTGRATTLSAGFDLRSDDWPTMVAGGARLAERIMSFPRPIIVACNGNAIAMAGFLLLSADHRIGVVGDHRIGLNEVAIGLTVPWFGIEIARHRLSRPYFDRCVVTGSLLDPDEALRAGFLDELVTPERLPAAAAEAARRLSGLDQAAHAATKLRVREQPLAGIRDGIDRIAGNGREW
jgi:enoyl-CoA hydratase